MRLWHFSSSINSLHKLLLQTRIRSHPVGLDVWFLVGPFVYFHTSCVWTAKAPARLRGCAGSPEPSLVAYVISTSWAGSFRDNFRGNSNEYPHRLFLWRTGENYSSIITENTHLIWSTEGIPNLNTVSLMWFVSDKVKGQIDCWPTDRQTNKRQWNR